MTERKPIDYLICAAGEGSRLKGAVSHLPKPLIKMNGETLLERSLSSLELQEGDRVIVITQKSHAIQSQCEAAIRQRFSQVTIEWLELQDLTSGQLETALAARNLLRPHHPVVIFNSDTYFQSKSYFKFNDQMVDGIIPSSEEEGDCWSFSEVGEDGFVTRVTEKVRISNLASVGCYYFGSSEVFLSAADQELNSARLENRESFVAPIYNRLISNGLKVVAPKVDAFLPMGTLEQIRKYWDLDTEQLKEQNQPLVKTQTRLLTLLPFLAGVAGFAVSLILFSPGFFDVDTLEQFGQALDHQYLNWHPPLIAFVWHYLLYVVPDSWGPFLLENVAFWSGLTLVTRHMLGNKNRLAATLILFLGLMPTMFIFNALVWKDAVMASVLLCAVGMILQLEKSKRPYLVATTIAILLFFGNGCRHNAILATFPLIIWLGGYFPNGKWRLRRAIGIGFALAIFFQGATEVTNTFITDKDSAPLQVLTTFDLAGMSFYANKNLFPDFYHMDIDTIKKRYRPNTVMSVLWAWPPGTEQIRAPGFCWLYQFPEVKERWLNSIYEYPHAYLQHRFAFFRSFLGLRNAFENGGLYMPPNYLPQNPSPFRIDALTAPVLRNNERLEFASLLYKPYAYLILFPLTVFFYRRRKTLPGTMNDQWEFFFGLSGLLYLCGFFFVGVASDFRYMWWTVVITTILLARFVIVQYSDFIAKRLRHERQSIE